MTLRFVAVQVLVLAGPQRGFLVPVAGAPRGPALDAAAAPARAAGPGTPAAALSGGAFARPGQGQKRGQ